MRPVLPQKKLNYKLLILYGLVFVICILGIGMSMYMQYFQDEKIGVIFGITDSEYEDLYNELKNNFNSLFTNDIDNLQGNDLQVKKIKKDFDIVATRFEVKEEKDNYTLDVSIPIINIDNKEIKTYNQEIEDTYKQKIDEIKATLGYIYNVRYKCYIQDNILSLAIYSELKEKTSNQKIMIETFNYNLAENKEVTLQEILNLKNIKVSDANSKIKNEIKEIQEKNDSLTELGYNMYKRDVDSDIYEVPNIEQFFIGEDGNVYVVFAYGNLDQTSEMDVVIFMNK